MDDQDPTVDAVVDYCETQARLLSGQAETLSEEIDTLLDEIDAEASAIRDRLDSHQEQVESPERPINPGGGAADEDAVAQLEAKQATVVDKQDRLDTIGDLSAGYVDLAESVRADGLDVTDAIAAVLEFEAEHGAADLFEKRETLLETAADR